MQLAELAPEGHRFWRRHQDERQETLFPVFTMRQPPESYRTSVEFGLELVGVNRRVEVANSDSSDLKWRISDVSSLLSSGESLSWLFASDGAPGDGRIRCQIHGDTGADSEPEAFERAQHLCQGLVTWLGATHASLVLEPVREQPHLLRSDGWRCQTPLQPASFLCRAGVTRAIGFGAAPGRTPSDCEVTIPLPFEADRLPSVETTLRILNALPSKALLSLRLTPFQLSTSQVESMRVVATQLGKGRGEVFVNGHWEGVAGSDARLLRHALTLAEAWAREAAGVKISATLVTEQRPTAAACRILSRELFPSSAVEIAPASPSLVLGLQPPAPVGRGPCRIDLVGCVNAESPLAWALPSLDCWRGHGIPIVCNPETSTAGGRGVVLGSARIGSSLRAVTLQERDRAAHAYICGATGTGKSTLLLNMVLQDVENGHGVCVIDPHGDLHRQVLASIPRNRVDDVINVDPYDQDWAVGLNLLERQPGADRRELDYQVGELLKVFDRLYNMREVGGPMFDQYMGNAARLAALNDLGHSTILDIQTIFEDRDFRSFLKARCEDPLVVSFWDKMAEKVGGDHSLINMGPYISSKLNLFTSNAAIRRIVGQPRSTIDFREAMDRGRIVLVNLSQGLLGELDTQLLGMLIISKLYGAAMGRASVPVQTRRPFYLYVDEFQMFTTDTVAHMLAGARKFGLCLTLANQNLSQLLASYGRQNILESVLGNCGTLLCFRLGASDAARLESYTQPVLRASDLQELPSYQAATRLLADNVPTRPFILATRIPRTVSGAAAPEDIVQNSRARYSRPATHVDDEIKNWRLGYESAAGSESQTVETASALDARSSPEEPLP